MRQAGKKYIMMVRGRIPGGVMTANQWRVFDDCLALRQQHAAHHDAPVCRSIRRQRSGRGGSARQRRRCAPLLRRQKLDFQVRVALVGDFGGKSRRRDRQRRGRGRGGPGGHPRSRAFLRRLGATPTTRSPACAGRCRGASWMVLCDTNGGRSPSGFAARRRFRRFPGEQLGIHAHNHIEKAVAKLAAVPPGRGRSRARERPRRALRQRQSERDDPDADAETPVRRPVRARLSVASPGLTKISHALDEILNRAPNRHGALCRRVGLRHQGGNSRLRRVEGPPHR